jgi:hypothetical protein
VVVELHGYYAKDNCDGAAAMWTTTNHDTKAKSEGQGLRGVGVRACVNFSLVEFKTCVNTVSNVVDHYDHSKHIRFPQILVLFCSCHI